MNKTFAGKSRAFIVGLWVLVVGGLLAMAITTPGSLQLQLRFNPYAILSASTLCLNLGLIIYFLRKPTRTDERIWLTLYLAALSVFAFGEMMQRLSAAPQAALFWAILSSASILFAPALYLFALSYTNQSERRYPGTIALVLIGTMLLFFFYAHTSLIFNDSNIKLFPWGYNAIPNKGISLALLWFDGLLILALVRFITFRRHTRNAILRKQTLLFILATLIPFVVGTFTDAILPGFGVTFLPPLAVTLFSPAAIGFVYGIRRYQLATISPTMFSNTMLNIMQEAVVATDAQLEVIYMNSRAEALFGQVADGKRSLAFDTVLEPHSVQELHQALTGDTGELLTVDRMDIKPIHGASVPVRLDGSRLQLGDAGAWLFVLADITKELQTRGVIEHEVQVRTRELHEARAYLVSSINSLEQGFVLVNAKQHIELLNHVASKLFKQSADAAVDQPVDDVLKIEGWNINLAGAINHTLESRRSRSLAVASADGSFYEVYVTPVLAEEHVLGAAVVIQDVTEQKNLERSKDEFFSIASHELRTPLTAIRGNMSMVQEYFPEALKDPGLAGMVTDTHDASVRLIDIVNDFLDSSRLEQGKIMFTIAPLAIEPVVEAAQHNLQTLAAKTGSTFHLQGLTALPHVMADESRLRQIIYNLLSNALKYSGDKAVITVNGEADEHKVKIRVSDTGKGISPEGQRRLFHKFQQAGDMLTRDDTKGTGLGLYISRLLAENMHGNVELEHTEVNKGSTFTITLPRANK